MRNPTRQRFVPPQCEKVHRGFRCVSPVGHYGWCQIYHKGKPWFTDGTTCIPASQRKKKERTIWDRWQ